MSLCEGRVAIVTGAGRGIGRAHALLLGSEGARVVVNDVGAERDGTGNDIAVAQQVVNEITSAGGLAVANTDSVSSWEGARRLVDTAIDHFGRLDVVVNNAGILRDRMLTNMSEAEWDAVIDVHLKGTFAVSRWASAYWRDRFKSQESVNARIINTTSVTGLYGNAGQTNYGAAKAGIAMFTTIAAMELARYGVTVNAVAPAALTRMSDGLIADQNSAEQQELYSPRWIAPVVAWLASTRSSEITGRVFEASGKVLAVAEGWQRGPSTQPTEDLSRIGALLTQLAGKALPNARMDGSRPVTQSMLPTS